MSKDRGLTPKVLLKILSFLSHSSIPRLKLDSERLSSKLQLLPDRSLRTNYLGKTTMNTKVSTLS